MAPNADGCFSPRGPGKGLGDKLASRIAEILPAEGGGWEGAFPAEMGMPQ